MRNSLPRKQPRYILEYVHHFGQVGAGRPVDNILPFIPKSELVPVIVADHVNTADDNIGVLDVCGVSLEDEHIYDGDKLIFKRKFTWREISEERVCIVYIHATGELVAKKIIREANMLTLRASGGGIKDLQFAPDEIEIKAIVIGHQRFADPVTGSFSGAERSSFARASGTYDVPF